MEQIKRIPIKLDISEFEVTFSYETMRGYHREQTRFIKGLDKEDGIKRFESWGRTQRTMFNVKILGVVEVIGNRKTIDL